MNSITSVIANRIHKTITIHCQNKIAGRLTKETRRELNEGEEDKAAEGLSTFGENYLNENGILYLL